MKTKIIIPENVMEVMKRIWLFKPLLILSMLFLLLALKP